MATSDVEQPGWRWRVWPWRKTAAPEDLLPALAHYHSLDRHRVRNFIGGTVLLLFLFIYGFFFSAFVPAYFAAFMAPLLALGLLVIWVLPDLGWAPTGILTWFFFATIIALIGWPDYLAVAVPGLPWITLLRATSFPLAITLLICLSTSETFRTRMKETLSVIPSIPILLAVFVTIQLISIALSLDVSSSIQKFIVAQVTWTATFFSATYFFLAPGRIKKWAYVLWALAIFLCVISLWEKRIGHLPWAGHIPSFLKVEDESVQRTLSGSSRAGVGQYRTQATFGTPLGLAEYLALTLPFVLHFATRRFSQKIRLAALCSIPLMLFSVYLTDAKLGTIGCLFGCLFYVFIVAFQNWRRNRNNLIAASVLYSYPIGFFVVLAAVLFIPRLHVMVLGGSAHAASTASRVAQYTLGMQKFLQWPFGYGIGQGATALGFTSEGQGMITIDTYYLSILLEYGIAGFIAYYGMFLIAIYEGCKRAFLISTTNEDRSFIVPVTTSLTTFILIKSVFSQQDNHPAVFMLLGALVCLAANQKAVGHKSKRTNAVPKVTRSAVGY